MERRQFLRSVAALTAGPATAAVAPDVRGGGIATTGGMLGSVVASMAAGTWALVPPSAGMDNVLYSAGTTQNMLIFGGSTPYDPVGKRILILGGDHGVDRQFVEYLVASHEWRTIQKPVKTADGVSLGSHAYQHLATDPDGNVYAMQTGAVAVDIEGIYKWDGNRFARICKMPFAVTNLVATALCWWDGKLTWYEGSGGGIYQLSQPAMTWMKVGQHPNQRGAYHNVCAPTAAGLVFGGGNVYGVGANPGGNWTGEKELYLLPPPGARLRQLPDAPFRVGIFNGMSLCGDGKGRVNLLGFGQFWRLDAVGSGTMTRLPDPPSGLVSPAPAGSLMSCAIDDLECAVYIQWDRTRTPKAAMYVFKP